MVRMGDAPGCGRGFPEPCTTQERAVCRASAWEIAAAAGSALWPARRASGASRAKQGVGGFKNRAAAAGTPRPRNSCSGGSQPLGRVAIERPIYLSVFVSRKVSTIVRAASQVHSMAVPGPTHRGFHRVILLPATQTRWLIVFGK